MHTLHQQHIWGLDRLRDHTSEMRRLARTAVLALVCACMYVLSRAVPFALRWLKYFCPLTAALAPGPLRYRIRHAFVSSAVVGIALHPAEALSYFLLIGSFGVFFGIDGASGCRTGRLMLSVVVYVLSFSAWLYAAPWLVGLSFQELAESLLIPRYVALKPALDAAGISRTEFMSAARGAGFKTAAALALSFYLMLYASNAALLAPIRRALRGHLEPPDGRPQASSEIRQRTRGRGEP